MASWDRRDRKAQGKVADALLRRQMRDAVGPFSPFWRERLAALRIRPTAIEHLADLQRLPAVGERDVCPDGDPRGAARLVLQATEAGFAMHADGPDLRKALVRRIGGKDAYRRQVEAEVRPTTYHFAGNALRFPVASTRSDLDLMARAGNRAWRVLGLTGADVLVSAVPVAARLDHSALSLAALAAGAPALFPGDDADAVAAALRLVPATVLAAPSAGAAALLGDLAGAGAELDRIRTVILVGPASAADRAGTEESLAAGGATARVLVLHGPAEGRVLWAECAPGSGLHTYPDLEVVELLDPETGENAAADAGGEVVLTQLGFHGTALVRWRTGDVVETPLDRGACPHCKRTVPRVSSAVRSGSFVTTLRQHDGAMRADLRAVASALTGRADVVDWRIEVRPAVRTRTDELIVFVEPRGDDTEAAVGVYRDVRAVAGTAPSQVVVVRGSELADVTGAEWRDSAVSRRIVVRR
ncbi:MAG TPA: hypothetical protein VNA12_04570 [Mycobacteriales bacterium]|nr:hypothetical protein [Mycobacteriales bacterium]